MGKHHKPRGIEIAKLELQIHELSNAIEERKAKKELAALRARMADHFYANSEPEVKTEPRRSENVASPRPSAAKETGADAAVETAERQAGKPFANIIRYNLMNDPNANAV
jgi:phage shock protein A